MKINFFTKKIIHHQIQNCRFELYYLWMYKKNPIYIERENLEFLFFLNKKFWIAKPSYYYTFRERHIIYFIKIHSNPIFYGI